MPFEPLQLLAALGLLACAALLLWPVLPARWRGRLRSRYAAARRRWGVGWREQWRERWRHRRRQAQARREAEALIRRAQQNARHDPRAARPGRPKDSREPH